MWLRICLSVVLTGCFSPRPPAGAPCPDGNCPDGQRCVAQICTIDGVDSDGSIDPTGDGPATSNDGSVDGPPSAGGWSVLATNDTGSVFGADESRTTPIAASSGGGTTMIVAIETDLVAVNGVTDTAGNMYSPIAGSRATNTSQGFGIELWMSRTVTGGATSVTATSPAGQRIFAVVVWEVAGIAATNPIDAVAKLDDAGPSPQPVGAEVTTTQPGDFVIAIAIVETTVENVVQPSDFVNEHQTVGNGWARIENNTKPPGDYSAKWGDQGASDVFCATTVAFKPEPN